MNQAKTKLILNIVAGLVGLILVVLVILNACLIANLNSKNNEERIRREYLAYLEQYGDDLTDFINSYSGDMKAQVEQIIRALEEAKNGR